VLETWDLENVSGGGDGSGSGAAVTVMNSLVDFNYCCDYGWMDGWLIDLCRDKSIYYCYC